MPIVEVWVDPEDCDGDCEAGDKLQALQARVDEAERLLRAGYADLALQVLTDDYSNFLCKSPGTIKSQYDDWKAGRLPGFAPPKQRSQEVTT